MEKAGFKKGKLFTNHYVRAINRDKGTSSALRFFYLERPGTAEARLARKYRDVDDEDSRKEMRDSSATNYDAKHAALRESFQEMLGNSKSIAG